MNRLNRENHSNLLRKGWARAIYTIALAVFATISLASCSSDEPEGKWDSMKWSKTDYKVISEDGIKYYYVPGEGIIFTFTCKNYSPWLSNVKVITGDKIEYIYPDEDFHTIDYESIHVKAEDRNVTVSFDPSENDRHLRRYMLTVTAGDVFGYFCFIQ